jgi:hypothetical protein
LIRSKRASGSGAYQEYQPRMKLCSLERGIPIIATRFGAVLAAPRSCSCSAALPSEASKMARMEYRKKGTCCGINACMIMVVLEDDRANW